MWDRVIVIIFEEIETYCDKVNKDLWTSESNGVYGRHL